MNRSGGALLDESVVEEVLWLEQPSFSPLLEDAPVLDELSGPVDVADLPMISAALFDIAALVGYARVLDLVGVLPLLLLVLLLLLFLHVLFSLFLSALFLREILDRVGNACMFPCAQNYQLR